MVYLESVNRKSNCCVMATDAQSGKLVKEERQQGIRSMTEKFKDCLKQLMDKFIPADGTEQQRIDAARVTSTRLRAFDRSRESSRSSVIATGGHTLIKQRTFY